jgi:hypothetical protein
MGAEFRGRRQASRAKNKLRISGGAGMIEEHTGARHERKQGGSLMFGIWPDPAVEMKGVERGT